MDVVAVVDVPVELMPGPLNAMDASSAPPALVREYATVSFAVLYPFTSKPHPLTAVFDDCAVAVNELMVGAMLAGMAREQVVVVVPRLVFPSNVSQVMVHVPLEVDGNSEARLVGGIHETVG